jgi:hypothetical protein
MELYDPASTADAARYAAEIILSICCGAMALGQLFEAAAAARRPGGLGRYFSSPAHWVDLISNALLVVCCALWWAFVVRHARTWSMDLRYDVSGVGCGAAAWRTRAVLQCDIWLT